MRTQDYSDRYEPIIVAWEAPTSNAFGEQVRLMDGAVRFVRKDGIMDVSVTLPDGGAQMDSMFKHETELLDTVWTCENQGIDRIDGVDVNPLIPPALASAPAVVSDVTPNISESQAKQVRQAVAWEVLSENTQIAYKKGIARLEAMGVVAENLTDETLAVVIGQMEVSPATLSLTVASVKWYHRHVLMDIRDWTTTDKRLLSLKRDSENRGAGQVDGLAWADVDVITRLSALDGTARGLRDAVLVRLMSDCLLRISEAVDVEDLSDSTLVVHRSKTDQTGEGVVLFVGKETMDLIRRYQAVAEVSSGALFRRIRRGDTVTAHRLTPNGARRAIKDAAELVGISPERVSGHSLRVGSAVSLAKAGASVVEMQGAGRWKSPQMPAHYARVQEAEQGAVARFRYGKGK